jgi:hypothetical protein
MNLNNQQTFIHFLLANKNSNLKEFMRKFERCKKILWKWDSLKRRTILTTNWIHFVALKTFQIRNSLFGIIVLFGTVDSHIDSKIKQRSFHTVLMVSDSFSDTISPLNKDNKVDNFQWIKSGLESYQIIWHANGMLSWIYSPIQSSLLKIEMLIYQKSGTGKLPDHVA